MTDTDWPQLYRDHVEAVSALVTGLDDADLDRMMPGTPEWTVRDVAAHLAGGPADSIAGRTDGAPGPDWTARHVAERRGVPLADVVAELQQNAEATAQTTVDNPVPAVVWDIAVHHADLHEGLGRGVPPERFWLPVAESITAMRARDLPPEALAAVPPYEVFRGLFSRRSRGQMSAWGTGLSQEQLDALPVFGPRDDDQPVPEFGTGHG